MARKITQNAVNALMRRQAFTSDNTVVISNPEGEYVMALHGSPIARLTADGKLLISAAGYPTHTTKERLNGLPDVSVHQKDFVWYVSSPGYNGEFDTGRGTWTQVSA